MIIVLNTAASTTTLGLYDTRGKEITRDEWESGRQLSSELLGRIEALLHAHRAAWDDISGIVIFKGPGSFTGLRIGVTVANTMAYAKSIPIVGEIGEDWATNGLKRLLHKANDQQVVPHYGAPATITKPKGLA